ncbi:MAG: hypothetical protein KME55_06225 [Nostoc indistinguendum CM1-VF10]|nr:hypothetical protein [Nostoc indistinguendum CM1-VF10]
MGWVYRKTWNGFISFFRWRTACFIAIALLGEELSLYPTFVLNLEVLPKHPSDQK